MKRRQPPGRMQKGSVLSHTLGAATHDWRPPIFGLAGTRTYFSMSSSRPCPPPPHANLVADLLPTDLLLVYLLLTNLQFAIIRIRMPTGKRGYATALGWRRLVAALATH